MKDKVGEILLVEDEVNDDGLTLDVFERNHMAMLLGYARQEQLEADISRVGSRDPLVLLEGESQTKGTPEVHERVKTATK
jgi:hypothetical protein